MPKYVTVHLTKAQNEELRRLLWHTTLTPLRRRRVEMIRWASLGDAAPRIAQHLGVSEQTVRKQLKAFNAGGFAALADRPRPGRPRALSAADLAALLVQIEAGASGERIWTLRQLQDWLVAERGVRISQGRLSVQLRRAKVRWKRLKRSIQHKAKPELHAQKTADLQTLQSFARQGAVDLVYVDASGFAPTFPLTYTWAPVGVRPLLRYEAPQKRRVNVYGALTPYGAQPRFVARTTTSKFTAVEFLDFIWHDVAGMTTELGELPAGFVRPRPCSIVLDNSSVHTSTLVKAQWARLAAADIHLFYLPTYSPFLNLIEALWRQLKHHEVPLRSYLTLEALLAAVIAALAPYVQGRHFSTEDFRKSA